jgi:hypothetical protein
MEELMGHRMEATPQLERLSFFSGTFVRRGWWSRNVQQETFAEMMLLIVTLVLVGGLLCSFFRALSQ